MKGDMISRSALIKAFHTDIVNHMQYIDDSTVSVCIAEIEEAPAVDAAPEVHRALTDIYVRDKCEVALADEVNEQLEAENAELLQKRKELEARLAAANKRADAAVEEICLKCHTRAAEFNLEVKPENCAQCKWHGEQEGAR